MVQAYSPYFFPFGRGVRKARQFGAFLASIYITALPYLPPCHPRLKQTAPPKRIRYEK